jgi:hypothetical protein
MLADTLHARMSADATTPDYAAVHADALQRMRDVLALPAEHWIVQYSCARAAARVLALAHASHMQPVSVTRST